MKAELILEDEDMVKCVKLDLTPIECLVLNQALGDYLFLEDRHEEDKQIARTMLEKMHEDFKRYNTEWESKND